MLHEERRSKARTIMRELLTEFGDSNVAVGQKLPSESELMQRYSVSRTTVRLALAELTNRGVIERRQGLGTFRAVPRPGRRATERSMLVGVWFNWPSGPLYGPMADGIRDELLLHDYHAVFEGGMSPGAQSRGIQTLIRKGLDGYIISPSSNPRDPQETIVEMLAQQVPLVLIDKRIPHCETDLVATNSRLGAETLVQHLIDLGHRRIGFVGTEGVSTVEDRLWGYRVALRRNGLEARPEWIAVNPQVFDDYGAVSAARLLTLPAESRPTALFGSNDPIAETLVRVARELGLSVPEQLSVVGFDDAGFTSEEEPWLTTYAQPKYHIGQQAAELFIRRILEPTTQRETILLEGQMIRRGSTGPAPLA